MSPERLLPLRKAISPGLEVSRYLPHAQRRMVGPFIFFDHAGPVTLPAPVPLELDVRPHPHIGLSTLTYLFAGEWLHRDSEGHTQIIQPDAVNWMTAGRGITHSERISPPFRAAGGLLDLIQMWVALPTEQEEVAPSFHHFPREALPEERAPGRWLRLVAGEAYGLRSPVPVYSPLFFVHATLEAGARLALPTGHSERAVFVRSGQLAWSQAALGQGDFLCLDAAATGDLVARTACTLCLLGGEPVGPRHIWWNFVSSSRERIAAAAADWREKRFPMPVNDTEAFIPLPD